MKYGNANVNPTVQILVASYKESFSLDSVKFDYRNNDLIINDHYKYHLHYADGNIMSFEISTDRNGMFSDLHSLKPELKECNSNRFNKNPKPVEDKNNFKGSLDGIEFIRGLVGAFNARDENLNGNKTPIELCVEYFRYKQDEIYLDGSEMK